MDGDTLVVYEGVGGDVIVPEGVKVIGPVAFSQLPELRSVALPESVERIGSYAFADCENLEEVILPEGLKAIEDHAFQNCPKLQELALPEGLEIVGEDAFLGCDALGEIALPEREIAEPEGDISPAEEVELGAEAGDGQPEAAEDEQAFHIVNPVEAIGVKENYTLKASPEAEGNSWTSDNEKYVKVVNSATGEIRGVKKGKATITVTSADGQTASTVVQVLAAPGKVSLSAKKGTLGANETVQLAAKLPKKTASQSISWTSNHPEIAKVNDDGLVTAKSPGKAKITAQTFNKKKASYTVTVKAEPEKIDAPEELTLSKGQKYTLNIALTPSTAAGKLKITNSNGSALKLDKSEFTASGKASIKLTAQAEGSATLRFELYNGLAAECEVKVCAAPTTLRIVNAVANLGVKEEYQLRAESDTDASLMMHAKWKSSNKKIIAVDAATGKLTAKKKGTATISVTLPKGKKTIKKSAKIKVIGAATGITLNRSSAELEAGDTLQLTATIPKKTASQIRWASDDEGVATVENGLVTAIGGGEATITARTFNGHSAVCVVTVQGAGENPPAADAPRAPSIQINGAAAGSGVVELSGDVALSWSSAEAVDSYDVRVDGGSGASVLRKSATTETGATIPESSLTPGETYTVRIAATRDGKTGAEAVARFRYVQSAPLSIASVQADRESAQTGDPVVWTASVSGGAQPLTYAWEVRRGEELEYSGTSLGPELTYAPRSSGSYAAKLTVTDAGGESVEATSAPLTVSERPVTPTQDFTFNVLDDTHSEITGYTGNDTVLILPETDGQGHVIQKIGDEAFKGNKTLCSVMISDSVEIMGGKAFYGCVKLISVVGGQKLTNIGEAAFYDCDSLVSYSFSEVTATIEGEAFRGCSSLQSFIGWNGITKIYGSAFRYCSGLKKVSIPSGVTAIGNYTFDSCGSLNEVSLPEGLLSIGYCAFSGCGSLMRIHIPDSVTSLADAAFYNCKNLEDVNYPRSWETCSGNNPEVFQGCAKLKRMVVPEGVTAIPGYAFMSSEIEEIVLPDTLTEIGFWAFRYCGYLKEIRIPSGVTTIDNYTFERCGSLSKVNLPEGLLTIGYCAFSECSSLTRIHIPDSVTTLADAAFYNCKNLEDVNYPRSWETCSGNNPEVFQGCVKLKRMVIPEGVTAIPGYAFMSSEIAEIVLPDTLERIGYSAFRYCSELRAVRIGSGASDIASNAFSDCDKAQLTFYGVAGSFAETWAELYGYNFSTEEFPTERVKLSGRVITRDEQPIPGVSVTIWEEASTDGTPIVTSTDENGDWSYDGAKAAQEYRIEFEKEGYSFPDTPLTITASTVDTPVQNVIGEQGPAGAGIRLSGKVTSATGAGIANVNIELYDKETSNLIGGAVTGEDGNWLAKIQASVREILVRFSASGYDFARNDLSLVPSQDQSLGTVEASIHVGTGSAPVVVAETPQALVGNDVVFRIQAPGCESVRLIVDNVAYESYPVYDEEISVRRAFTRAGDRQVVFQGYVNGEWGQLSAPVAVSITSNGTLAAPTLTCPERNDVGTSLKISWSAVEHAEYYVIYVHYNGASYKIATTEALEYEIQGEDFSLIGQYSVEVIACGVGYSQNSKAQLVEVVKPDGTIGLVTPKANSYYVIGDTVYIEVDNPNLRYVWVTITPQTSPASAPVFLGDVAENNPNIVRQYVVEHTGTYLIEAYSFAAGDIFDADACLDYKSRKVTVRSSAIKSGYVGDGSESQLISATGSVTARTNDAVDRVLVYEGSTLLSTMTFAENGKQSGYERIFTGQIPQATEGQHSIRFEAYDGDGNKAELKLPFKYYAVTDYKLATPMYPVYPETRMLKYPDQEEIISVLPMNSEMKVIGKYGEGLYFVTYGDVKGYVFEEDVFEYDSDARSRFSLRMTSPTQSEDFVRKPGDSDANRFIKLTWEYDSLPEGGYFKVGFVRAGMRIREQVTKLRRVTDEELQQRTVYFGNPDITIDGQVMLYIADIGVFTADGKLIKHVAQLIDVYASENNYNDRNSAIGKMFDTDNTIENKDLALYSAIMMDRAYDKLECMSGLKSLGFENISCYNYGNAKTGDHVAYEFGQKTSVNDKGEKERVYAIILRGTTGRNEWISNFNLGYDSLHTGFSAAAIEMGDDFDEYWTNIESNEKVERKNTKLWITGHSRGGAVANIYAALFAHQFDPENIYCYTFACPRTTTVQNNIKYIHNYIILGDLVPELPMSELGFTRYGVSHYLDANDIYPEGKTNSSSDTHMLTGFMASIATKREIITNVDMFIKPFIEEKCKDNFTAGDVFGILAKATIKVYGTYKTIEGLFTGETWLKWAATEAVKWAWNRPENFINNYINRIDPTHDQDSYYSLIAHKYFD